MCEQLQKRKQTNNNKTITKKQKRMNEKKLTRHGWDWTLC